MSSPGCRRSGRWRSWILPTARLACRHSGQSPSRIGRSRRLGLFSPFSRSGICGGRRRIRRAKPGVAAAAASDQDLLAGRGSLHPVAEVIAEEMSADSDLAAGDLRRGASGTRTHDLSAASRTLSQLSYSPESVVLRKVNAGSLAVSGRVEAQVQLSLAGDNIHPDYEHVPGLAAIDPDCVDLIRRISACHVPLRRVPRASDADADDARPSDERSPFALHTQQPRTEGQNEVVASVFCNGSQDVEPGTCRLQRDRQFRDVAFLIRSEHERMFARAFAPLARRSSQSSGTGEESYAARSCGSLRS